MPAAPGQPWALNTRPESKPRPRAFPDTRRAPRPEPEVQATEGARTAAASASPAPHTTTVRTRPLSISSGLTSAGSFSVDTTTTVTWRMEWRGLKTAFCFCMEGLVRQSALASGKGPALVPSLLSHVLI